MNTNGTCAISWDESNEIIDRAEQLIWRLLDDQLSKEDILELDLLLAQHQRVRETYLSCVALHADLVDHFRPPEGNSAEDFEEGTGLDPDVLPSDAQFA